MPTPTIEQVLTAAAIGEGTDWEFKSARGGIPGDLWETYSAMANTEGGAIVLGAREENDRVHLDGLTAEQAVRYERDLWNSLNNRGKVSVNLLRNDDLARLPIAGGMVLVMRVPRASRAQRPVYLNGQPFGNTYRRHQDGDYRCQDAEVRRMFADAEQTPADHRILEGISLADLDAATLTQYRQRFRSAKGDHPWLSLDDRQLLEKLHGWRRDRGSCEEGLTQAGLLMFGKGDVIRDPAAAPNYFVDYREKLDPATRWTDRIYPDGTWEANLFQFYQRVWPKLAAGVPVPFQLEAGVRRDETPVHEALREAFVNALIHADYLAGGGIVIERCPDRFLMENPGTLLVSLEQFRRGGVSECRNTALQQMFLMIGGGERAGSGVDKIRSGWKSRHWRAPLLETQFEPDRVRLTLPMVSLIPDDTLRALRSRFPSAIDALLPAQLQALATACIEGYVSNARLQELMEDHPVEITRMLQELCERGLLVSDNRRRWTRYRLADKGEDAMPLFAGNQKDSERLGGDSERLGGDSERLGGDSERLGDLNAAEWKELEKMAQPVAGVGKVSPDVVQNTVLKLCQGRYLQAGQISRLLKRHPVRVRQKYLKPLVEQGRLRLRFPSDPNRPDQAYTASPG